MTNSNSLIEILIDYLFRENFSLELHYFLMYKKNIAFLCKKNRFRNSFFFDIVFEFHLNHITFFVQ